MLGVHRLSETSAGVRVCRRRHQNYSLPGCCLPPALPRYYRTQTRAHSPSCSASVVAHRIALARCGTAPSRMAVWHGAALHRVMWRGACDPADPCRFARHCGRQRFGR